MASRSPRLRPLSVLVVLLLITGCDSGGPTPAGDPPSRPFTSAAVTVSSDTLALPGTLLTPDTSAAVPGVDHYFLDDGTTTTADAPLTDLIAWIRNRDG